MKDRLAVLLRLPYLPVIGAPFVLMAPVYLTGRAIFWGTPLLQFVPWWSLAWETIKAGHLPLWNPLVGMGAPLLANYQAALFYPPTWLYFLWAGLGGVPATAWWMALQIALHLAFAGLGMALLARRLGWGELAQTVCGLAFSLSGYLVARSHFLSINAAVSWLPWILLLTYQLATSKRRGIQTLWLALAVGLQLLSGHAQTTWYTLLLAGAWGGYWGWRTENWRGIWRVGRRFLGALVLGVGLAAVQLLPTAEYLLQSQRAAQYDYSLAMQYSFWPWRSLTLLAANLFGNPVHGDYWGYGNYWEDAIYVGLLPFLLAIGAVLRRGKTSQEKSFVRFLVATTVISVLLALGDNTPVFPWLYSHVPTFDMFQAPTRYTLWTMFALALLAGMGVESWRKPQGRSLYWSRLGTAGAFAVVLGAGMGQYLLTRNEVVFGELKTTFVPALALAGVWGVGTGVLNLLAPTRGGRKVARSWIWAVVSIVAVDLLVAGWGLNPAIDLSLYAERNGEQWEPQFPEGDGRVYLPGDEEQELKFERFLSFETFSLDEPWINLRAVAVPNVNILDGIASANNFDPLVPGRYATWMEALDAADSKVQIAMLAQMGVGWVQHIDADAPLGVRFDRVEDGARLRWVPCAQVALDGEEALKLIRKGQADYREAVVLEKHAAELEPDCFPEVRGRAVVLSEHANQVVARVEAPTEGWLVLSDVWYPGWEAWLDGERVPIERADYLFRAVRVGEGVHQVIFSYRPLGLYLGAGVSLFSGIALLGLWRGHMVLERKQGD